MKQIEPTNDKIEIQKGAEDKVIEQKIDSSGKREFMQELIKLQ